MTGLAPLAAAPIFSYADTSYTKADDRQYFEWLQYTLPTGKNKDRVEKYYEKAAIPALNKMGIDDIGVFYIKYGQNAPTLYVLIPHDNLDSVMNYRKKLMNDDEYRQAAKDMLESDISSPAYIRLERGLMHAFKGMPKLEPKTSMGERLFELRIYESHNYVKGQKKIDMFNDAGEIQIFRDTGLNPVFFGETLFGPSMPNLTYMLAFKNMQERDKHWKTFVESPGWNAIKGLKEYKDTVSNITDIILRPAACSQI